MQQQENEKKGLNHTLVTKNIMTVVHLQK